ncbi:hypothetical protein CEXT_23431, partial [Caerostris extrusa]
MISTLAVLTGMALPPPFPAPPVLEGLKTSHQRKQNKEMVVNKSRFDGEVVMSLDDWLQQGASKSYGSIKKNCFWSIAVDEDIFSIINDLQLLVGQTSQSLSADLHQWSGEQTHFSWRPLCFAPFFAASIIPQPFHPPGHLGSGRAGRHGGMGL